MMKDEKVQMVATAMNMEVRDVWDAWNALERYFTTRTPESFTRAMEALKEAAERPLKPSEREVVTPTGMKVTIKPMDAVTEPEGLFCGVCGRPMVEHMDPFFTVEAGALDKAATKRLKDFFEEELDQHPMLGKVALLGHSRGEGDFFSGVDPIQDLIDLKTVKNPETGASILGNRIFLQKAFKRSVEILDTVTVKERDRVKTGIPEIDAVLEGGIKPKLKADPPKDPNDLVEVTDNPEGGKLYAFDIFLKGRCPKCHGRVEVIDLAELLDPDRQFAVHCYGCPCEVTGKTRQEAVDKFKARVEGDTDDSPKP